MKKIFLALLIAASIGPSFAAPEPTPAKPITQLPTGYSPYMDITIDAGILDPLIEDITKGVLQSKLNAVTLAFLIDPKSPLISSATSYWNGDSTTVHVNPNPTSTKTQRGADLKAYVAKLKESGKKIIISTGGWCGLPYGSAVPGSTAAKLKSDEIAKKYADILISLGLYGTPSQVFIDLDIEGCGSPEYALPDNMDAVFEAMHKLQKIGAIGEVLVTVPVRPHYGMCDVKTFQKTSDPAVDIAMLTKWYNNGLQFSLNIMTMNADCTNFSSGFECIKDEITSVVKQLPMIFGPTAKAIERLHVTPMIGQNDWKQFSFKSDDVTQLLKYITDASQQPLRYLHIWSLTRDMPATGAPAAWASPFHSGWTWINQKDQIPSGAAMQTAKYAFTDAMSQFVPVEQGAPVAQPQQPQTPVPTTTQTPPVVQPQQQQQTIAPTTTQAQPVVQPQPVTAPQVQGAQHR